jgi:pyrimidine-nucleoside phosphorylase
MSGRGPRPHGGTLDKLESIPGFRVELSIDEFVAQVRDVGMAIIGARRIWSPPTRSSTPSAT